MTTREREVLQLLEDYNLKYDCDDSWPLNDECVERMNGSLVGQSYRYLEHALTLLRIDDPEAYGAIKYLYLSEESSASDLRWLHSRGTPGARAMVEGQRRGISRLCLYLREVDLYVRWPRDDQVPKDAPSEGAWSEAVRIVHESEGAERSRSRAVREAALQTGLSERTIWRALSTAKSLTA